MPGARVGQDRALGPGGVVLRQPGDLLEQLAAPLVVEPLGRQVLRGWRSGPRRTSARSAGQEVVRRQPVDRSSQLAGHGSRCPFRRSALTGFSAVTPTAPGRPASSERSGTSCQPGSSSRAPRRRCSARPPARVPQRVAPPRWPRCSAPSVSSRLNRAGRAVRGDRAHASPASAPGRPVRRPRSRSQHQRPSQRGVAARLQIQQFHRRRAGARQRRRASPGPAVHRAVVAEQPAAVARTARPPPRPGAGARRWPTRTAASTAPVRITRASVGERRVRPDRPGPPVTGRAPGRRRRTSRRRSRPR